MQLRWRIGALNSSHTLAKLLTPFGEQEVLRLTSISHPEYVTRLNQFFLNIETRLLLMHGTEGEIYANPQRCPEIHFIRGQHSVVLQQRQDIVVAPDKLPIVRDVPTTACWTGQGLAGEIAVPYALVYSLLAVWLLAVCLQLWSKRWRPLPTKRFGRVFNELIQHQT
ncbi:MAG: hypothetical protein ACR5LF_15455 [Symbiopectobacterium sp.]